MEQRALHGSVERTQGLSDEEGEIFELAHTHTKAALRIQYLHTAQHVLHTGYYSLE